jgi:predicted ATP-grasp superfamily ATP-dependent carboligase
VLPDFDLSSARRIRSVLGKAIVFAREDAVVGDTRAWLGDETVRDIPKPREQVTKGQPICTVFAEGPDIEACHARLKERAQSIVSRCSAESSS